VHRIKRRNLSAVNERALEIKARKIVCNDGASRLIESVRKEEEDGCLFVTWK
jgi:hypothetical protein